MGELVASLEEVQQFASQPGDRRLTPALRGVLAETAVFGYVRWAGLPGGAAPQRA